jgi:ferredoxin
VQQALADEKERLEAEKTQAVEAAEKKYSSDLERDLGDLTQEIVQRIAASLLAEGGSAPVALPSAAPRPAAAPAQPAPAEEEAAPEAAPAEEDEDDDVVVSADPYIDTPLCTSCNECTKINSQLFAYDGNKQAYIADADAGTFRELVMAAEKCPVKIIHPGKPRDESEQGLDDLIKRAEPFN